MAKNIIYFCGIIMRKILRGKNQYQPRLSPMLQLGRRTFTHAEVKLIFSDWGEP